MVVDNLTAEALGQKPRWVTVPFNGKIVSQTFW